MIEAERGQIYFDEENKKIFFQLYDGHMHYLKEGSRHQSIKFQKLNYFLNPPAAGRDRFQGQYRDKSQVSKIDMEMNLPEILKAIEKSQIGSKGYFEYLDEFHGRIVTTISCFAFAIFALPMGIYDPRNPKTMRFVYMILMMIVYYSLYSQARNQFAHGNASAAMLYLPLVLAIGLGVLNYFKINYDLTSIRDWIKIKLKK